MRFCNIMKPYMTLCYIIKNKDIDLFWHIIKEIAIILQVLAISKPKYTRLILRQLYIFDTKTVDPIFREAYLANTLINLERGL